MNEEDMIMNAAELGTALRSLNTFMLEQAEGNNYEELVKVITSQMQKFLNPTAVVFSKYYEDKKLLWIKEIKANQGILDVILKAGGKKILSTVTPVSEEMYHNMTLERVSTALTLKELSGGAVPDIISKALGEALNINCCLILVYMLDGQLYGTTTLVLKEKPNDSMVELLKTYAHFTSISLKRVITEQDLKESEQVLKTVTENMTDLVSRGSLIRHQDGSLSLIGTGLDITEQKKAEHLMQARLELMEFSSKNSLDDVLQRTLDIVCAAVESPIGLYHFVSPDEKNLILKAWSTDTLEHYCEIGSLSGMSYSVAEAGVWVDCIRQRKPVIHNDYKNLPHRKGMPDGHAEVNRELVVPIMRQGKIAAVLGVGNKAQDYTDGDVQIVTYFADVAWEVAERKQTEELLRESEQQFRLFFENMAAGVSIHEMVYDQDGNPMDYRFVDVNPEFEILTGLKAEDIVGRTAKEVLPGTEQNLIDTYGMVAITGEPLLFENYSRDIDKYFSVSVFSPKLDHFAAVLVDITERKKAEEHIRYIGYHDNLTDLYNRHYYEMCKDKLREIPVVSVIMTDVNGLKLVNDTCGHKAGDKLLKKYAELIRKSFKHSDLFFRWGGDEFIIILKNTGEAKSWELCNRLIKHCGETFINDIPLSISVGISSKLRGENIDKAIQEAENMMYKNKLNESKSSKNLIMKTLLQTLSEKSYETKEHIERMSAIGRQLGKKLSLPPSEMSRLQTLTMLHDIGKINIDGRILLKKNALTDEEWEEIRKHPEVGYRITRTAEEFAYISEEILAHHERWDGRGYPRGLAGEGIPYLARVLTLIDSYDVMSNGRPYKQKMTLEEIIEEIERCSGKQFDPALAEEFVVFLREGS